MKGFFNIGTFVLAALTLYSYNLFSAGGLSSHGRPIKKIETELISTTANSADNIDHSQWDKLLKKHVDKQGFVDYAGFKRDVVALDTYLEMLSKYEPGEAWRTQELLTYYINLYNAGTVKLIVENHPVKSIKDISRPWGKDRISIGDKKISLDVIEHGILRKINEPRIHFALNCASISCPKLLNEAYTASKINEQLERVTKEFINGGKNDISASNPQISSIFDWYRKDFKVNGKTDVIAFINRYSKVKINPNAKISYMKYDWNLNGK